MTRPNARSYFRALSVAGTFRWLLFSGGGALLMMHATTQPEQRCALPPRRDVGNRRFVVAVFAPVACGNFALAGDATTCRAPCTLPQIVALSFTSARV